MRTTASIVGAPDPFRIYDWSPLGRLRHDAGMSKTPKIIQIVNPPAGLCVVWKEAPNGVRMVTDVVALALLADGSVRPMFIEFLKGDNVGRLALAKADALLSPPP